MICQKIGFTDMLRKVMSQILPLELCRKVVSVMLSSSSSSSSSSSASLDCESLMTSATNSSFHLPELEKLYFNFSELEKVCFYFSELEKLYFFQNWKNCAFIFQANYLQFITLSSPGSSIPWVISWQKDKKVKRQKDKRLKDQNKSFVLWCQGSFAQGWKTF